MSFNVAKNCTDCIIEKFHFEVTHKDRMRVLYRCRHHGSDNLGFGD